ncbi:beta-galactosidase trimerization domain-containing protein [Bacillus mojavensis]|uniref:beta-galactosidase trimerization domain-containing protein n=1 Tax=Bacillus mojavensis TaxID=72360 RepID=UPI002DB62FCE|nr:beta-galactosidase trimerization domain-containing protein [Bacillus mojavensis]MEC1686914.1 beta-galactosidase trimerization domain-containing protein [Bacillus mojavensis]
MLIGFNYHPSKAGCQYWKKWNREEIENDFKLMYKDGFNSVRFFIFWADFEKEEGVFDHVSFERLIEFVQIAKSNGLYCIPSILTIWMNGQLFDLPWREGRSLWRDPVMIERQKAFVRKVVKILKGFDNIYAFDLGDEMPYINFKEIKSLTASEVHRWLKVLTTTIRKEHPEARIMMANDHFSLIGDHKLNAEAINSYSDFCAVHGFPLWTPFHIESNSSYKASLYVSYLTKLSLVFGTSFIDEFGLYGSSETVRSNYIKSGGLSVILNGAKGLIAWCFKDFASRDKPYHQNPTERFVGFYDLQSKPKESALAFKELSKISAFVNKCSLKKSPIGIYVSSMYFEGNKSTLDNADHTNAVSMFYADLLLTRAHIPHGFAKKDFYKYDALILPGISHFTNEDKELIRKYVENGGTVIYTPGSYLHGFGGEDIFGVELSDFSTNYRKFGHFSYQNNKYEVDWNKSGFSQVPIIQELSAEVLARYPEGEPSITCACVGKGKAYYINAPIELSLNMPFRLEKENFRFLYKSLLADQLKNLAYSFTEPEIEIHERELNETSVFFLINHTDQEIQGTFCFGQLHLEMHFCPKEYICVIRRGDELESLDLERPITC